MPGEPLVRHPDAASRVYEEEAFIVVPALGEYNILNRVGSRVWDLIDGTRSEEDLVRAVAEEYDVSAEEAQADVRAFVEALRKHNMVL